MNPIYKFTLSVNGGTEQAVKPIYKDDLAKDFEQESNQQFFRQKLSGKLTFINDDYSLIKNQTFDTEFGVVIYISYDMGQTWTNYWSGLFWKTDCEFDDDGETCVVTPSVNDVYRNVIAGMEKEYNLIDLAPVIQQLNFDKRPMIQVYVPGESAIGCFLAGMWWEQECTPESDINVLTAVGDGKLNFAENAALRIVDISGNMSPQLPDLMTSNDTTSTLWSINSDGYTLRYAEDTSDPDDNFTYWEIVRNSDNVRLWYKRYTNTYEYPPYTVTLNPVEGTVATGDVTIDVHDMRVYTRYVLDVPQISGVGTFKLGDDDIVGNNRNYNRVIGYGIDDVIYFSSTFTTTPTPWGIYQPGQYYQPPYLYWDPEIWPVARTTWGRISIWYTASALDWYAEEAGRQPYTLRDAYPIASVISVLLGQIAPGITHQQTTAYSQFLYGTNPLLGITQALFITPKSNIISAGYDQPAQKAPITLKRVMDMLRDSFRCYWYIEDNKFKIEHIRFFNNGGAYSGTPVVGRDLTTEKVSRNGKDWAFVTSQYKFDKPEMAARYQFGWMDDVTLLFDGFPIDIVSKYVNPDNIEQIEIAQFTSDIDYILLNPGEISKDGFVLLSAILQSGTYKLPYVNFEYHNTKHILQNAYVSFMFLQQYYAYDMPARNYKINGEPFTALGIKKLKTQTLKFPAFNDPNTLQLIKTHLGNGMIQKMSVNLSSRNANTTLKYDTE